MSIVADSPFTPQRNPMSNLLYHQLDELLTTSASRATLWCERALRVGAATLCRGPGEITATTVVCNLFDDNFDAVRALVSDIADEYGLVTTIQRQQTGSYSVRFSWPQANEPAQPLPHAKSAVARLLRR